ncbi:MAG: hypothetical protein WD512_12380 [Candidatus Paceibacterota bacterium]
MNNSENDFDHENVVSPEEQRKIDDILVESHTTKSDTPLIPNLKFMNIDLEYLPITKQQIDFDLFRRVGISKVVTINNISGKKAWIMLTPAPITRIGTFGLDKLGHICFVTTGECKTQQIYLPNGSRSEYDLDNSLTNISLFLLVDGKWKKVWLERLFNTRKYNINILEKHVDAAVDYEFDKIA